MKLRKFFAFVGVFAFLFVIGCSNDTGVDNPTANNSPVGTLGTAGTGSSSVKVGLPGLCGTPAKEDNQLNGSTSATVYYNWPAGPNNNLTRYYTIDCKVATDVTCTIQEPIWCGSDDPNYYYFNFTTPATADGDRCRLTLWFDGACTQNIGSDSWVDK